MNGLTIHEKCFFCNKDLKFSTSLTSAMYTIVCGFCDIFYIFTGNGKISLSHIYFNVDGVTVFMFPKNTTFKHLVTIFVSPGCSESFNFPDWEKSSIDDIKARIKKLLVFL